MTRPRFLGCWYADRAAEPGRWGWARVAALTAVLVATYTAFSEWMNTGLLRNWQYSEWMPVLAFSNARIGLSPLLQSALLPPLALWFARTVRNAVRPGA